ncbi:unnamed protein product [Alternaria alternata]
MLRDPRIHEYDILAIQEPWRNPSRRRYTTQRKTSFISAVQQKRRQDPPGDHKKWQFKEHSRDICSLTIEPNDG